MDFKYIIIRASSALLLLSGPLFTACDDDDPDAFITVSKQEIEVEYNGLTANGETVNFDLGSNHAWQATYVEEWIHPTSNSPSISWPTIRRRPRRRSRSSRMTL